MDAETQTAGAAPASPYPAMFSQLQVGQRRLRNRLVHAAMSTRYAANREVTPRLIDYHANRARGGAAMIVTEPLGMTPWQTDPGRVAVHGQDNLDGLKRWADAVESEDCRLLAQVQDSGRGRHKDGRSATAFGASARPDDWSWTVPHVLSLEDIERLVENFVASSRTLQRCGFSGVELSAGHGHLFHQFMSPWSNGRDDAYGGELANRLRLVQDIIEGIRAECGGEFIVGLKLPGDDGVPGGIGPAQAAQITRWFAARRQVDYFAFCMGSHHRSLEMHVPDMHTPRGTYFSLIKSLRPAAGGIPVCALGRIVEPAQGEALLADGSAELIGLGRTLVTDAAWGRKAAQGRDNDIRKCISGNNCWGVITDNLPLACDNNPRVGQPDEVDWWPAPASVRRRVVVVGAGIAGLEAAWLAAARGHEVTLFGASREPGGKTRLNALLPGCEPLSAIYDYQIVAAARAGLKLELGWRVRPQEVLALDPAVVVLAAGGRMSWPTCLPEKLRGEGVFQDLRESVAGLLEHPGRQPGTAVLYDHDHMDGTYSAAELLCQKYDRVVVITPREQLARDEPVVKMQSIYRRLHGLGVEIVLHAEPVGTSRFIDGIVTYRNVFTGAETDIGDVALFTFSTPRIPDDEMAAPLRQAGLEVHVIGDCYAPCSSMAATAQGHTLGNLL